MNDNNKNGCTTGELRAEPFCCGCEAGMAVAPLCIRGRDESLISSPEKAEDHPSFSAGVKRPWKAKPENSVLLPFLMLVGSR